MIKTSCEPSIESKKEYFSITEITLFNILKYLHKPIMLLTKQ